MDLIDNFNNEVDAKEDGYEKELHVSSFEEEKNHET